MEYFVVVGCAQQYGEDPEEAGAPIGISRHEEALHSREDPYKEVADRKRRTRSPEAPLPCPRTQQQHSFFKSGPRGANSDMEQEVFKVQKELRLLVLNELLEKRPSGDAFAELSDVAIETDNA